MKDISQFLGAAAIADAMMSISSPTKPAFGVVASISSVCNVQMRFCESAGCTMVKLPIREILAGEHSAPEYRDAAVAALTRGEDTILLANTSYDRSELQIEEAAAEARGMTLKEN